MLARPPADAPPQAAPSRPSADQPGLPPQRHLVTVGLEDYFHVGAFNRLIQRGEWYRFELRLERGTQRTLDLLDEFGVRATFFALGWVADQAPELIRAVAERGHEIASKGYYHRSIRNLAPSEFRDDLARAREALQRASGQAVLGFRLADGWFRPSDLWALDVLADEGYDYDSSVGPVGRLYASQPWRRFLHSHHFGDRTLWEFPISTHDLLGFLIPIAGGNWFRQLPRVFVQSAVRRWMKSYAAPFVMYFHTWEMDPEQPRITAASAVTRVRHYRNLARFGDILRYYLTRYRFTGIADYLGVAVSDPSEASEPARDPVHVAQLDAQAVVANGSGAAANVPPRVPVSIVVPCHNEELILPYLANTLASVRARLAPRYQTRFLFVDDGSTDDTWGALHRTFGEVPACRFIRHTENQGVAQGILTGLRHADTEIVCSIDCDCTYDPHELDRMIPLLVDGVDIVTGSPYHRDGRVRNVPAWRLWLSRGASGLHRLVLHNKLRTYTSCFRVYRRSAVIGLHLDRGGFLGVIEMLGKLDLSGRRIVEFPTTLEVRLLGRSKMKILRTIVGHLRLLAYFIRLRLTGGYRQAGLETIALPKAAG